jgi:Tfp pilus assembly protein PilV
LKNDNFSVSGLSLMEVMISIFLLTIILLSIITIFPSNIESLKTSKNMSIACNIANKHLELYKSNFYNVPDLTHFNNVEITSANHTSIDPPSNIDGVTFTPYVKVTRANIGGTNVASDQVIQVAVKVEWKQMSGVKSVTLVSYIYNKVYLPGGVPVY